MPTANWNRLILDRETMHFKEMVAVKYAELTYNGLWFTPLREAIDAFVNSTPGTRHRHGAAQAL